MIGRALATAAALVLAAPTAPVTAQSQDAAAIVARSARVYRSLTSLQADFAQSIEDPMIGSFESRGTLVQAGDAKLAMRFSDPAGEAIVLDGRQVWVYTPSSTPGQVMRLPLPSGGPAYGFNLLAWFLDRPAERYRATYVRSDRLNGRTVDVIELVPLSAEMPFRSAVLWLDREDALPRRLEIDERSGAQRTVTLSRMRVNVPVADSTFIFDVPAGVRVIDQ